MKERERNETVRTDGDARVRVSFLQTMIWRTSSGPMMYVEGSTALVVVGFAVSAPA